MATGIEAVVAIKILTPIFNDLYAGAKDGIKSSLAKWRSKGSAGKFSRKLLASDKIKTIWSPDKSISLLSLYYPSCIMLPMERKVIENINDFEDKHTVIEGIVGQGKSFFLRYLCLQELTDKNTGRIPVFIELRNVSDKKNIIDSIKEELEKFDLEVSEDVFAYLLSSGKISILLDGFDELDEKLLSRSIVEIENLAEIYQETRITITSRPDNEIQRSRLFSVEKISPLFEDDYDGFFKKLKISIDKRNELAVAIKNSPSNISTLINTPLMLTLLVMVYETEKEIPSELPEFFEKLFHTVFTKHDRLKAGFLRKHNTNLSERKLHELFEAFCFMVMQYKFNRTLDSQQFHEAFDQAIKYTNECICKEDDFKKDITKVSCLMLEEGFNQITFLHKSILEYYSAGFIKRSSSEIAEIFYKKAISNYSHWKEVLSFLSKIDIYRYAKYVSIPCAEKMIELMDSKNIERSEEDLIKLALAFFPKAKVHYAPEIIIDEEGDTQSVDLNILELGHFGPMGIDTLMTGPFQKNLKESIIVGLQLAAPEYIDITDKAELRNNKLIKSLNNESHYEIAYTDFVKIFQVEDLLMSLGVFENNLHDSLNEAKLIVSQEQSKVLIFMPKN